MRRRMPARNPGRARGGADGPLHRAVYARAAVALRTDELESFRDRLRALDAEGTGQATLEPLEEQAERRFEDVDTDAASCSNDGWAASGGGPRTARIWCIWGPTLNRAGGGGVCLTQMR